MMGTTHRGLFGAPMLTETPLAQPLPVAVPDTAYKRPSTGRMIAGSIGDALQNWSGGRGTFLPGLQQQREMAQRQAQYQQQRADKFADWKAQADYERLNPKAGGGTALQQNYEYLKTIDPNAAESYLRTQTTAPPIVQTNPDGTKTIYPSGAIPQAGATPQRQILQQLPPGAVPMGGAPSQGARTFPVR